MAREEINIGLVANDGTGDPLRDAFTKINSMTDELYNWKGTLVEYVNKPEDFPTAVAGVITLAANTTYQISGFITISDRLAFDTNSAIIGLNRFTDFINYTGSGNALTYIGAAGAGTAYKWQEAGILASSGTVFDITGNTTQTAVLTDGFIADCVNVGSMNSWGVTSFRSFSVVSVTGPTNQGLRLTGSHLGFNMDNSLWRGFASSGIMLDLGTAVLSRLQIPTGNRFEVPVGVTAISGVTGGGNITSDGFGLVTHTIFQGDGTHLSGITPSDTRWFFQSNLSDQIEDSRVLGIAYLTTGGITLNPGDNSFIPLQNVTYTTDTDATTRVSISPNGEMEFTGFRNNTLIELEARIVMKRGGGSTPLLVNIIWEKSTDGGTVWNVAKADSIGIADMDNRARDLIVATFTRANTNDKFRVAVANLESTIVDMDVLGGELEMSAV